jgi:hypothetical protein
MTEFNIEHFDYFKYAVKELKIQPSEVWNLDLMEINSLADNRINEQDLSIMLNFERKINGATDEWLQKNS